MLYALIMAGGRGMRFWPKSRARSPKQLLSIAGRRSMLQATLARAKSLTSEDRILVIAERVHLSEVTRQLSDFPRAKVIQEPFGRNTAAACGLGAIFVERHEKDAVIVVLPADHIISDYRRFSSCIRLCSKVAKENKALVTIGIEPTYPATGYGYIKIVTSNQKPVTRRKNRIFKVERFVEKPDKRVAERFLKSANYLWNSGIFVWRTKVILGEIQKHLPRLSKGLKRIKEALGTRSQEEVIEKVYQGISPVSIDYGVMEKARDIFCVKANFGWDDCGSWASLERLHRPDKDGNIFLGNVESVDTKGSIIFGSKDKLVATVGVKDLIVVNTDDATLVCPKERAEDVKRLVENLGKKGRYKRYL